RSSARARYCPHASRTGSPRPTPRVVAISQVDVVAKLESLAASNPQKLNWITSIVDLLKLLGLDSSLEARKGLATELGCPKEKMGDSAQMNMAGQDRPSRARQTR